MTSHRGRRPVLTGQSVPAQVNNAAAGGVSKARRRKNWRKSVIQLVPATAPPAPPQSQPDPEVSSSRSREEMAEAPPKVARDDVVVLRLPRAMGSQQPPPASSSSSSQPLGERNSTRPDQQQPPTEGKANGKAKGALPPRSPTDDLPAKLYDEKENHIV